jgi:hypothetical protein
VPRSHAARMTPAGGAADWSPDPLPAEERALVSRVVHAHQRLMRRLATAKPNPADVLNLGTAVILHGTLERRWLIGLRPLLDRAAAAQLDEEHVRLEEDLELLESIFETCPDSPDVGPLCGALLDRLREHVDRDERVLYRLAFGAR